MTTTQSQFPSKPIQSATFAARLLTFLAALGLFGTLFLPWIQLDGHDSPSTGAQLITTILAPEFAYLTAVSQYQAWIVVGCPFVIFVAIAIVAMKKYQREPSPVAECVILASAGVLMFVPTALTAPNADMFYLGIFALVAITAVLLAQDLLTIIRERGKLERRAPGVDQVLGVISASGEYEWAW